MLYCRAPPPPAVLCPNAGHRIMPDDWRIEASTCGCVMMLCALGYAMSIYGASAVGFWYCGPLLITNAYLILYTWLQHTHPDVPHYGSEAYTRLKGALSTIDRPYNWIIDHCHHRACPGMHSANRRREHVSDDACACACRHRDDTCCAPPVFRCAVLPCGCADRSHQASTR